MSPLNVFRILGDLSHTASKCILIRAIHVNQSAEGVSLITQALYAVVFCTRYLDLFWTKPTTGLIIYITFMKIFYITTSLYLVFVILAVFPRTLEREKAWKFGAACFGGSLIATPFALWMFNQELSVTEVPYNFSIVLESVAVLPQLLLLRQTTVPTVIDSYYLLTLGSYRALYIGNWIERGIKDPGQPRGISVVFGVIQTLVYLDFAWVFWTRQRVKLRNGAIVDSEDFGRGYLVSKIFSRWRSSLDLEDRGPGEDGEATGRRAWGARGISVSADEEAPHAVNSDTGGKGGRLSAPEAFEDQDSDVDDALPPPLPRGAEGQEAGHEAL